MCIFTASNLTPVEDKETNTLFLHDHTEAEGSSFPGTTFALSTHLFFRTCYLPLIAVLPIYYLIAPNVHLKYKKCLSFWSDKRFLFFL